MITDPEGLEWTTIGAVNLLLLEAEGCVSAIWYFIAADGAYLWFPAADIPVLVSDELLTVAWNSDPPEEGGFVFGGVATMVSDQEHDRVFEIQDGQDCTHGSTSDFDCVDQVGTVSVHLLGEDLPDPALAAPAKGAVGWATDALTGDPVCGEDPSAFGIG